jgi:hypothetical protein
MGQMINGKWKMENKIWHKLKRPHFPFAICHLSLFIIYITFFFIANSQWPLVDENGELAAEDKLRDPVVLKIKLDARER